MPTVRYCTSMMSKGEEGRYLGLDGTDDGYFHDLLAEAARIGGVTIVCHTENIELVNRIRRKFQAEGRATLRDWCRSKPAITEAENCVRAMYFAEHLGARIYVPHLSSRLALDEVRKWRLRYGEIFVETCPHYLTHTEDSDIGSLGKANPPFRTQDDVDAITSASARVFGLAPRKGTLRIGADADLTLVDLEKTRQVNAAELGSYSDYSLYDGWSLKGWPVRTMVRGTTVMENGRIVGPAGHGQYLRRDNTGRAEA